MNLKPGINIFTGHVHSGKTTVLMDLIKNNSDYCGILAPGQEGERRLFEVVTGKSHVFQLPEKKHATDPEIGKFIFDKEVFALARNTLLADAQKSSKVLLVDEIGQLELADEGLEPALGKAIKHLKKQGENRTSVFVVRDTLLPIVVGKYGLEEANIINHL